MTKLIDLKGFELPKSLLKEIVGGDKKEDCGTVTVVACYVYNGQNTNNAYMKNGKWVCCGKDTTIEEEEGGE